MEDSDWAGVVLSFWAGAATGLGAMAAVGLMDLCARRDPRGGMHSVLAFSLALAAGVMICVSVVDLWLPMVFAQGEGLVWPSLAVAIGFACFRVLSHVLAQHAPALSSSSSSSTSLLPMHNSEEDSSGKQLSLQSRERNFRLALTMFFTLTLHNFPEGLAVSVSNSANERLGYRIAIAIAFHNFPEGVAIAVPYYAATGSKLRAIALAFISGLSEPVGALVSVLVCGPFFRSHARAVPYALCVVGGIMLASAVLELLPEARAHHRPALLVLGLVCGAVTMLLTIWATE